jgi:hypothetical protein
MKAAGYSETLESVYQTTRLHILEASNLNIPAVGTSDLIKCVYSVRLKFTSTIIFQPVNASATCTTVILLTLRQKVHSDIMSASPSVLLNDFCVN